MEVLRDNIAFLSSVKEDVWHSQKEPQAYEWWYFDAVSDDGKDAVSIIFNDNFIYSPRYNKSDSLGSRTRFPAISFVYFRDGKAICRCVNEFSPSEFEASEDEPACRMGRSSFRYESAGYGSGFTVRIDEMLVGGRRVEASLEWLSIESDLSDQGFCSEGSRHSWNLVAPRSDVTGKIRIVDRKGKELDKFSFRGTGYHDHNLDGRWLAGTIGELHWGRAHFADRTAVFYRLRELWETDTSTKLVIIKDGKIQERSVTFEEQSHARDRYGKKYPSRLRLASDDRVRLRVKPLKIIDSSFYFLRFLSEITLTVRDGVPRKAIGISEYIAPSTLKYQFLNRLSDIRTGKNGKPAYF